METEIKKVNSLDELDKLTIGDYVRTINYAGKDGILFEGKFGDKYAFIDCVYSRFICSPFPIIFSHMISGDNLKFENGNIRVDNDKIKLHMYNRGDDCYQEKLNLIKGKLK